MIFNNTFFFGEGVLCRLVVWAEGGAGVVWWPSVGGLCRVGWVPSRQRCFVYSKLFSGSIANFLHKTCTKFENDSTGCSRGRELVFRCLRSFRCCCRCCRPCKHCAVVGVPSKSPPFFPVILPLEGWVYFGDGVPAAGSLYTEHKIPTMHSYHISEAHPPTWQ